MHLTTRDRRLCRCGHARAYHLHYRPGTDCSYPRCGCGGFHGRHRWPLGRVAEDAEQEAGMPLPGADVRPHRAVAIRNGHADRFPDSW